MKKTQRKTHRTLVVAGGVGDLRGHRGQQEGHIEQERGVDPEDGGEALGAAKTNGNRNLGGGVLLVVELRGVRFLGLFRV